MKTKNIYIILALVLLSLTANAQTDTLRLDSAITRVLRSHPTLLDAQEAINVAENQIKIARSGYLPTVSGSATYTRLDPVSKIKFGTQDFSFIPNDNYDISVKYSQILYDFGKTAHSIELEQANKAVSEQNIETLKQKLAMNTISTYYVLAYLDKAISIKDEEIRNLNNHLQFIETKAKTGSATQFEILTTKVKISNTESQKVDLQSNRETQQYQLNNLMGVSTSAKIAASYSFLSQTKIQLQPDSLISYATQHRNEIAVLTKQQDVIALQLKISESQNNPVLAAFATVGGKNGYTISSSNTTQQDLVPNLAAGVSFNVPLFDGFRKKNMIQIARSRGNSLNYQLDNTKRAISNEVANAMLLVRSNKTKIEQFKLQVQQASSAVDLAKVSFEAGAITNMELLDAETNLAESKLLLIKSQVDYQISLTALDLALGNRLY